MARLHETLDARRRGAAAAGVALAAALAVTSTAAACTPIMGLLTLSPTSGRVGATITASGSGMKVYPAKYRLLFWQSSADGNDCMSSTRVLIASMTMSKSGTFAKKTWTVPSSAVVGSAVVCGMENYPVYDQTGTTHDSFTVT